jgi:hypothetical protein
MVCCKCWSAYRDLVTHGYTHETVKHTIGFLDVHAGAHTNPNESTLRHVRAFLNPYNLMADYISHLSHCIFEAGCRSDNVHWRPWTSAPHLPATTVMSLRHLSSSTPHFSPGLVGSTSPRLTWYFHLRCYTRHMPADKIRYYSATSGRSSRKDSPTGIHGLVFGRAKNRKLRNRADSWSVEWSVIERLLRTYIVTQAHYGTATTNNDGGPR